MLLSLMIHLGSHFTVITPNLKSCHVSYDIFLGGRILSMALMSIVSLLLDLSYTCFSGFKCTYWVF